MIDQEVPNKQFHPYQPPDAVPHAERPASGFEGLLEKIGMGGTSSNSMKGAVEKGRDYARANPAKVLGGLAALVIGAGLMRGRTKPKITRPA